MFTVRSRSMSAIYRRWFLITITRHFHPYPLQTSIPQCNAEPDGFLKALHIKLLTLNYRRKARNVYLTFNAVQRSDRLHFWFIQSVFRYAWKERPRAHWPSVRKHFVNADYIRRTKRRARRCSSQAPTAFGGSSQQRLPSAAAAAEEEGHGRRCLRGNVTAEEAETSVSRTKSD